ncbi:unnamed protein product [Cylicocyclus nassatus]|uniref:Uncharacterized protein n=1 Tax=Cylicocyclus nassatus TaxID=53992 RepID=A0AA36MD93_CYLNA|nr:unnamed protein product [Cylicocyclus nassatus]
MTTANPQQRQFTLFHKFSTEVRPSEMLRRDDRIRSMTCSFEEIAESEEEDTQFPERTSPDGRSPFAVAYEFPFTERRQTSPRSINSTFTRKLAVPRLCRGFSNPCLRHQEASSILVSLSPNRHEAGSDFSTLPSIPETASS